MRLPTSLLVLLSSLMLLLLWDSGDYSALAVRSFPGYMKINGAAKVAQGEEIHELLDENALLHNSTRMDFHFQDSKRRVPSCPDPLHNR
ncbi:hypothetical protein ACLOJK_032971 [Asimina triloba]